MIIMMDISFTKLMTLCPYRTFALASLAASASAAIARCRLTGRRTSLTSTRSTVMPEEVFRDFPRLIHIADAKLVYCIQWPLITD